MTKKGLKIWALCLALFSCVFVMTASNTDAANVKKTTVKLTEVTSNCTWVDFDFGSAEVKWVSQTKTTSGTINCTFGQSTWQKVTYKADNLVNTWNSSYSIAVTNLKLKGGTVTLVTWNLTTTSQLTTLTAFTNSTTSQKVYSRTYDKLWKMNQKIELELTIPAGQAAWTYTGSITLDIESGT